MESVTISPETDLIVIPARWGSTRFEGKPLHLIDGVTLIERVWGQCKKVKGNPGVVIATDDERIYQEALGFGADVKMTKATHQSGTDRVAEIASMYPEVERLVNVQGDEPLIDPTLIECLFYKLKEDNAPEMVTASCPLEEEKEITDLNVVKVVTRLDGEALYFSRATIPNHRNKKVSQTYMRHLGIYGYQRDFLFNYIKWPVSNLEKIESLEQLRALENGARIYVEKTNHQSPGVDTLEQALEIEKIIQSNSITS